MSRILVVDDDAVIRQSLERALVRLCPGCEVQLVDSAASALEALRVVPADLIFSDHSMPGMTGLELFAEVKGLYPQASRYLITAYPLSELSQDAVANAALTGFLAKPFNLVDIKKIVDDARP